MRRRALLQALLAAGAVVVTRPTAAAKALAGMAWQSGWDACGDGPPPLVSWYRGGVLGRTIPDVLRLNPPLLRALRQASMGVATESEAADLALLRRAADRAVGAGPFSVMDKAAVPPSGDKHDYYSVGPYWWPNPTTPDGLPYVQHDGELSPRFRDNAYDFAALDQMAKAVGILGVAYYATGDARYAESAAGLIRTWFLDPATRMNPHLRYSQTIPGRAGERAAGIIDGRPLLAVVDTATLLAGSPRWSGVDDAALRAWFVALVDWLQQSPAGQQEACAPNNHASWYAAQLGVYALFAREGAVAWRVATQRTPALIASQIEPDGRQPHELARTRPFHYSVFNLEALMVLDRVAGRMILDAWEYETPDGRSLRAALDYLLPFATGAAPWPYSDRDFDARELAPLLTRGRPERDSTALIAQVFPDASPLQQLYLRLGVWWTRG